MRGFTLIEILVASTIFAIAVSSISALFVASLRGQRNIFAHQILADNVRSAFEQMSRQIRMAQRDEAGTCTGTAKSTYSAGGTSIQFIDHRGNCLAYQLLGTKMQARPNTAQPFLDLTSNDIKVTRLNFVVNGRLVTDAKQPKVTIIAEAEAVGQADGSAPRIILQTTISARNIDVP